MSPVLSKALFLLSTFLALNTSIVVASSFLATRDDSSTLPAPLSISPDENWDGIDGTWSSFTLRVGTPEQAVRTFISFNGYQTWVVLPFGCQGASDVNACGNQRGGIFNINQSSTWDEIGIFDLAVDKNLGLDVNANAKFGYDTVGLGGHGEGGPTVKNTTVGGMAALNFYIGLFGLDPKPSNFTDSFNVNSPSYLTLLKEQKGIASLSAGYTAGAHYRYTGVLASLTLGGYDSSKFISNDVEFVFAPDNERTLMVSIQSISTPSADKSSPVGTELLPNPIYAMIDSTVAEMWLPRESCDIFQNEFGLTWDNTTELYLVNNTQHDALVKRNASITFQIAQGPTDGKNVQIQLPYAAFDLTAQTPYQGLANQSYYFPLRRAANDSQYNIGRFFLQEAYLTVDWEKQRFNVSQVAWSQTSTPHLVVIPPYTGTSASNGGSNNNSGSSSNKIAAGAIAGIVIGAVLLLAIIAFLLWFFNRRRKAAKSRENEKLGYGEGNTVIPKAELEGSSPMASRAGLGGRTEFANGDSRNLLSAGGSTAVANSDLESPLSPLGGGGHGYFGHVNSPHSPSSASAGEGTHSSTQSENAPFSPMSTHSEADSKEMSIVHEMPGDIPAVGEKDGRSLTEKEAIAHRERVYNGVDSAPTSAVTEENSPREPRRLLSPDEVTRAPREIQQRLRQQHQPGLYGQSSPHAQEPYSVDHQPAGYDHGPFGDVGVAHTTPDLVSPIESSSSGSATRTRGLHRAFSFEREQNSSNDDQYE